MTCPSWTPEIGWLQVRWSSLDEHAGCQLNSLVDRVEPPARFEPELDLVVVLVADRRGRGHGPPRAEVAPEQLHISTGGADNASIDEAERRMLAGLHRNGAGHRDSPTVVQVRAGQRLVYRPPD